eukprot:200070-Pyramimonas_sp.AAC.1
MPVAAVPAGGALPLQLPPAHRELVRAQPVGPRRRQPEPLLCGRGAALHRLPLHVALPPAPVAGARGIKKK